MLKYDSIAELVNEAEKRGLKLSELVLKTQAAMTEKDRRRNVRNHGAIPAGHEGIRTGWAG